MRVYDLPVSAGGGSLLESDHFEMLSFAESEIPEGADFGVRVSGNSMEPQFINGQTVWVHSQETLSNGEIGIFYYNGDAYCKKYFEGDGCVKLISLNPSYDPIQVDPGKEFRIFGKVVG